MYVAGGEVKAHRYSYAIHKGDPTGFDVLHHCDVRRCVFPKHLYLGDAAQNARDREDRNPGTQRRGATHPRSKLTWEQVVEIRMYADQFSRRQLAHMYGVTHQSVSDIISRRTRVDA